MQPAGPFKPCFISRLCLFYSLSDQLSTWSAHRALFISTNRHWPDTEHDFKHLKKHSYIIHIRIHIEIFYRLCRGSLVSDPQRLKVIYYNIRNTIMMCLPTNVLEKQYYLPFARHQTTFGIMNIISFPKTLVGNSFFKLSLLPTAMNNYLIQIITTCTITI